MVEADNGTDPTVRGSINMDSLQIYPRKNFSEAVDYAVQITSNYLQCFEGNGVNLAGANYLELGRGSDFAAQLVFTDLGACVTLADKYLAPWDPDYHPGFYAAFLEKWGGPKDAIRAAVARNGYDGILTLANEAAEHMPSLRSDHFDIVASNAVLEHVVDMGSVAAELARVTRSGGIHSHQIDFRDHRNFSRPLEHLLIGQAEHAKLFAASKGVYGSQRRMPEVLDELGKYFWLMGLEVNDRATADYTMQIQAKLPEDSPYLSWPTPLLQIIGARVWMVKKSAARICP